MRDFTPFEQRNIQFLVNQNAKFALFEITQTGLTKHILDATASMRTFFVEEGIHDYECQAQGPEHKCLRRTYILTAMQQEETTTSFYRPNTKQGDPRMWVRKLGSATGAFQIHAIIYHNATLHVVNMSQTNVEEVCLSAQPSPLKELIQDINRAALSASKELLARFLAAKGTWFPSEVQADTGIGRALETYLGIPMNSSKSPDYKGIEIKSHREKRLTRKNVLFTQSPDWDLSTLKSTREIVERYGYTVGDGHKTYQNTVQCSPPNSQGLRLNVNQAASLLELQAERKHREDIAVWRLLRLHNRLLTKHHETFWVEVESETRNGQEYFRYKQIEHTKNPAVGQFDILLEQNLITVDLLLCRPSGHGDTYSFKIKRQGMPLLFPYSITYNVL